MRGRLSIFTIFVLLPICALAKAMENEPHEIPTPPFSYRFVGHVTSSTFAEFGLGTPFTGILAYTPSSRDSLPYVLKVTIQGKTFSSADYQIQRQLSIDTLDLIASQHRMEPQSPDYEGREFGLRFFASGARWVVLAHAELHAVGEPVRTMMLSGHINQFSEIDAPSP